MSAPRSGCCGRCAHFIDDPDELESALTGMTILSSAWGDTRGDQGLCDLHHRFLQPAMTCPAFESRAPSPCGVPTREVTGLQGASDG